ncbi:MAG TPA: acyl carrier protein [Acidobacteriota bacterium]|nr:acyl carrier protein [Acidobacteriota bacterium]
MSPSATAAPSQDQVEEWIAAKLAEIMDIEPEEVERQRDLTEFGLSSIEAVMLSGDLEEWLERELPDTLVWDHPTVRAIAQFVASAEDD